jgi:hypothetical protein
MVKVDGSFYDVNSINEDDDDDDYSEKNDDDNDGGGGKGLQHT